MTSIASSQAVNVPFRSTFDIVKVLEFSGIPALYPVTLGS